MTNSKKSLTQIPILTKGLRIDEFQASLKRVSVTLAFMIAASFTFTSCEKSSDSPPVSSQPTPPSIPVAPAAPQAPAIPAGDLAGFPPEAVLSVTFKEINAGGYPMVMLKNLTGRDIDDIRGSFQLRDADGNILHATGLTVAVPGQLFLAAGAEQVNSPYGLNNKADLMKQLASSPNDLVFSFVADDIKFMESPETKN
jgi:hypothetical protein